MGRLRKKKRRACVICSLKCVLGSSRWYFRFVFRAGQLKRSDADQGPVIASPLFRANYLYLCTSLVPNLKANCTLQPPRHLPTT